MRYEGVWEYDVYMMCDVVYACSHNYSCVYDVCI